ncbi:MAG: sulfatase [Gemmataceae bacterium]|nr:sulfatase [Gemmataceae bacterium]MDW8263991.1 sulfatase [Gemmataceae bacterium]
MTLRHHPLLRPWAVIAALAVLTVGLGPHRADAADAPRKPNIIVILADDLGYADVGFHGCKDIPTPNLDALAASGVRCTNGYVSGPYCSPTRAGLLTGRYQNRFGHEFNPGAQDDTIGLPVSETTLADRLKAAGYATGWIGKWHLGSGAQFHPLKRGFDETFGFMGGAHSYFPGKGGPIFRGTQPVEEKEYLTDAFAREAVAFIDRNKARPFFLYLAFNAVHTPMDATEDRLKKFSAISDTRRRTYAAMTLAMDEAVGRVLDKLRAEKLDEDTLLFFFSDNGGPTMPYTSVNGSSNAPLRGSKRTTLEGGIRVPFVVAWKRQLPAGKVYHKPVIQLDILPTCLAAAGVAIDPAWKLDGVNLLPYLRGDHSEAPHETLYWRFGGQMAIRQGDWKLVRYDQAADQPVGKGISPARLYNLAEDIGEANDLASARPEKVKELQALWDQWNAQLAKPLWADKGKGAPP